MTPPLPEEPRASWWLRSAVGRWLLLSAVWIAVGVLFALQQVAGRELEWAQVVRFSLLDWAPWIVLSPAVLWLARRVQIDGRNWRRTVPVHIGAAIVTAVIIEFGTGWFMSQVMPRPPEPPREMRLPPRPPGEQGGFQGVGPDRRPPRLIRARLTVPVYFLLVAAAHAVAYHRRSLERERRALTAEARLAEARLLALQTQIHPHFLFNTLNAISSLLYSQPQAADEMLCALSELLRSVLATAERREVALAEELEFTDRYLAIQQIRFADRLTVRREIDPGLENAAVPTLILQPLVENAVIHGIAPRSTPGVLILRARREGDRLRLSVSDTGAGDRADGEQRLPVQEHVGLGNTRARLAAFYGGDAHFELAPAAEGGLAARLDLPWREVTR